MKYVDADTVSAKIKELKSEAVNNLFIFAEEGGANKVKWQQQKNVCEKLISFIDTLQEQPVEGLGEAAGEYASDSTGFIDMTAYNAFKSGAEWMKDKIVTKK